jgi:DNA-directed RNA polymerase specialized sigma24 family protein
MDMNRNQSGSRRAAFPVTRWSIVIEAARDGQPNGSNALGELCRLYWYPVYAFLRRRESTLTRAEAEDLTQAFFLHLMENGALGRADRFRGSFRGFLIGCLKHFEANEQKRERALKRGGKFRLVSFDVEEANDRYLADSRRDPEEAAERVLDRQWARVVTENALARIRDGFGADQVTYERLKVFLIPGSEPGTYESAAKDLGVSLTLLKSVIHRLRREYRDAVRAEVASTVSAPHEIDAEIRHLVSILADEVPPTTR